MILHNLIVRMQQNGDFRDEAAGANLITEFLGTDETSATIAATEYETNCQRIEDEVRDEWEQQVVRWTVNDRQYMDYNTFVCLETELINYHTATGHDVGLPVSWMSRALKIGIKVRRTLKSNGQGRLVEE